jgi:serpin B
LEQEHEKVDRSDIFGFRAGRDSEPSGLASDKANAESKADLKELVRGNNEFAFDLYRQLSRKEGNIIFSPSSLSTALAMTYGGARGETAEQMAKALHFTLGQDRLHPAFSTLTRELQKHDPKKNAELHTANALWGQKGLGFRPEFLRLTREHYGADLYQANFQGDPDGARQAINNWVLERTKSKIKDLLRPEDVHEYTQLILVNAAYFQAAWWVPFSKAQTKDASFFLTAKDRVSAPTMRGGGHFGYFKDADLEGLALPYRGYTLSMIVLQPRQVDGLAQLEKSLTTARFKEWLTKFQPHIVDVSLPKFRVTARFQLKRELAGLGMSLTFSSRANFTGITSEATLTLGDVIHQGFIQVDEQGTEAAGATAILMPQPVAQYPGATFRADRPFLFLIQDHNTGVVLFVGRVTDPSAN